MRGNQAVFHVNKKGLLRILHDSVRLQRPLAVVRVGDGENIIMAQYKILSKNEFMRTSVATQWPKHGSGVKIPNRGARNLLAESLKLSDVIGILPYGDTRINAPAKYKRPLTDRLFLLYEIRPRYTFDAFMTRTLFAEPEFWKILQGRQVAFVTGWGRPFLQMSRTFLQRNNIGIAGLIPIRRFEDHTKVLEKLARMNFDVVLIGAGAAAIPIAAKIAKRKRVVAFDVGKAFQLVAKGLLELPDTQHANILVKTGINPNRTGV